MSNKSCLIVDDSATVRNVAKKILAGLKFDTTEAENGKVALDKCSAQMPDAVLLDWKMPVMDGLQFVTRLRNMAGGDWPIVVFCTTVNDVPHIQAAIDAGADEYIMKPFDVEIIESKFAQVGLL